LNNENKKSWNIFAIFGQAFRQGKSWPNLSSFKLADKSKDGNESNAQKEKYDHDLSSS